MKKLFKPASDAEIQARRQDDLRGVHTDPIKIPDPNRRDSFWHSGDVAVITFTSPKVRELRKITLTVRGEIELEFVDAPGKIYRNNEAIREALSRGYTDTDLTEEDLVTGGKVKKWIHNNWFRLAFESSKRPGRIEVDAGDGGDTFRDYSKGIEVGQSIIVDDDQWAKLFS